MIAKQTVALPFENPSKMKAIPFEITHAPPPPPAEKKIGDSANSPGEHDHEVHDVPAVAQVRALVQREAQRQDLDARLEAEDGDEVGLRVLLRRQRETGSEEASEPHGGARARGRFYQSLGQRRLVVVGQVLLQRQHDAVCDDCGEDHPFERSGGVKAKKNVLARPSLAFHTRGLKRKVMKKKTREAHGSFKAKTRLSVLFLPCVFFFFVGPFTTHMSNK